MDERLQEILVGAETQAITAFQNAYNGGLYDGWFDTDVDSTGFLKLYARADGAAFQRFKGEFDVERLVHRNHTIIADTFGEVIEIPIKDWEILLAWLSTNFGPLLAEAATNAAHLKDELITDLLKQAIDENAINPNLFDDSVFFGEVDLPGSGGNKPASKLSNRIKAKSRDADGVRDAFYAAKGKISKMLKPNGKPYHGGGVFLEGFDLMFSTADEQVINRVFDNNRTTSRDSQDKIMGVDTVENNLWDAAKIDGLFLRPKRRIGMALFQVVMRTENPEFFTDMPPSAPGGFRTAEQQTKLKYTSSAVLDIEVGLANAYAGVWIDLPAA